jgi:hypothetical protein
VGDARGRRPRGAGGWRQAGAAQRRSRRTEARRVRAHARRGRRRACARCCTLGVRSAALGQWVRGPRADGGRRGTGGASEWTGRSRRSRVSRGRWRAAGGRCAERRGIAAEWVRGFRYGGRDGGWRRRDPSRRDARHGGARDLRWDGRAGPRRRERGSRRDSRPRARGSGPELARILLVVHPWFAPNTAPNRDMVTPLSRIAKIDPGKKPGTLGETKQGALPSERAP